MPADHHFLSDKRIVKAASVLDSLERRVLILAARDGLRNEEIASRLAIDAAAVERALARAIAKLAREVDLQRQPWWRLRG